MNLAKLKKIISRKGYNRRRYRHFTSLAERWRYFAWKGIKDADIMMHHFYDKAAWYVKKEAK